MIALMLITITEKSTLNRLSGKFGAFTRGKEHVANATKQTKHRIVRRATKNPLKMNGTLKSSRRLHINDIGRGRGSLGPEMRQKIRSNHHRTSNLKKMTMLMLSHAILSMRTRTRELSESTMLSKNTTQMLGDVLNSRVSMEHANRYRKLGKKHGCKTLIYGKNLTTRGHKIQPGITRKIINNNYIVAMAPFRRKGSWTPNIRVD
jgi:hypothetical protein